MTEWDGIFKSWVFDEPSEPASRFRSLTSLDGSVAANDESSRGHTSTFENSWDGFRLPDGSENTIETLNPASIACVRTLSPAGVSYTYSAALGSDTFDVDKSREAYGKDSSMEVAGMSEGRQATRTQSLGEELAS